MIRSSVGYSNRAAKKYPPLASTHKKNQDLPWLVHTNRSQDLLLHILSNDDYPLKYTEKYLSHTHSSCRIRPWFFYKTDECIVEIGIFF